MRNQISNTCNNEKKGIFFVFIVTTIQSLVTVCEEFTPTKTLNYTTDYIHSTFSKYNIPDKKTVDHSLENCAVGLKAAAAVPPSRDRLHFIRSRREPRTEAVHFPIKISARPIVFGSEIIVSLFSAPSSLSLCFFQPLKPPCCYLSAPEFNRGETSPLARPRTGVLERACRSDTTTPGCRQDIFGLPMIITIRGQSMATRNHFPAPERPKCAPRSTLMGLTRVI